ncbi:MAG: rhodanese-like domain-containing protein, partial [Flavitalea sp.]
KQINTMKLSNLFGGGATANLQSIINEDTFLVDVRTPGEFAEGFVKGSVNIPLDKVAAELEKFKNKKNILVFCRSGARSGQAKSILEQNGFTNVVNGGTWDAVNEFVK